MSACFREKAGALLLDGPRLLRSLASAEGWAAMRNRGERLTPAPDGRGWRCDWEYSRSLHLCRVFPRTANWLLRRALAQWPLGGASTGNEAAPASKPDISFIIGHRGMDRLPLLLLTLESILSQRGVSLECIVVEQDASAAIRESLPGAVRHLQVAAPGRGFCFNRSAAFNAGARAARADLLVLHDGDLLVPRDYALELLRLHRAGWEAAQPVRFVYYLDQASTERWRSRPGDARNTRLERVVENVAGGSLAIARTAYEALGGMDEEFSGWGGEDNEFLDRCLTRRMWRFGHLPLLHLWHPSVAERDPARNPALGLLARKRRTPPAARIEVLRALRDATPPGAP